MEKSTQSVPTRHSRKLIIEDTAVEPVPRWIRLLLTCFLLCILLLLCCFGGLLNRCRGGLCDFSSVLAYWPAHVVSRLVLAVPTGVVSVSYFKFSLV